MDTTTLIQCPGERLFFAIPGGVSVVETSSICTALLAVNMLSGVASIGNRVFFYCTSMTSATAHGGGGTIGGPERSTTAPT